MLQNESLLFLFYLLRFKFLSHVLFWNHVYTKFNFLICSFIIIKDNYLNLTITIFLFSFYYHHFIMSYHFDALSLTLNINDILRRRKILCDSLIVIEDPDVATQLFCASQTNLIKLRNNEVRIQLFDNFIITIYVIYISYE